MAKTKVANVKDIPAGQGRVVNAKGVLIALFNADGKFYAINNSCAHRGGPLGEGDLEGTTVTCPLHGWQYDVTTGESDTGASVSSYKVTVEGEEIFVEI
ncbi:MAG: Rieske 2Fe-2S domain-containing protein [Candidatus Woesearchaeota archaeon]|nr:MAG: Rieske 2Fe-2S domain-containing protein [Candidatus Woesearchaeota archaeon]